MDVRPMANAIRALAMDAVEAAKSGHPGMPMGMADAATVLFTRFLKFDPADPDWRWACIVRLPQAGAGAHAQHDRLPAKPSQRPRVDVRPAPSA